LKRCGESGEIGNENTRLCGEGRKTAFVQCSVPEGRGLLHPAKVRIKIPIPPDNRFSKAAQSLRVKKPLIW
jgi:hypothetical protein